MWFSTLAYVTLAVATTLQPISNSNIEESARSAESNKIVEGWGAVKSLFDDPSKITDAIHGQFDHLLIPRGCVAYNLTEGFDSLSASAHTWYDSHFSDTGESFWDKIVELGPNIKKNIEEYADELFLHAVELYPSDKLTEFRESMVNVTATATVLHKVCSGAAEDSGVSFQTVIEEHQDMFFVLFEGLMEMFPPPDEAPGHDNRTIMISTALDRFEEVFLQVATELGVSEELLKSHSNSLKFVVQHVIVTMGDLVEQHPDIAKTLLFVAIAELAPSLLPEVGVLFDGWLLRQLLRLLGFGPLGPIKGGIAAWLQRWIFGPIIPGGSWFAVLQRLAMIGTKL
ncbi:hypothetical protein EDD22DRAFT_445650 [Suillus occidentalis]|nr:hypothetical protein EDD22DRAFT_445650 [Suillus occidentalis]